MNLPDVVMVFVQLAGSGCVSHTFHFFLWNWELDLPTSLFAAIHAAELFVQLLPQLPNS
jgi:hypothetical protein